MEGARAENMEQSVRVASEWVTHEAERRWDDEADCQAQVAPVLPPHKRGGVHEPGDSQIPLISRRFYLRAPLLLDGEPVE